jgi:DNA-binding transcriptional ArsR family regulator
MNDSGRITATLACLADPSRYKVLSLLVAGDYCVTEIAVRVGLSQSCTTRHLQILQRAGVLTRTRMGKRVLFRIREGDPELDRMLELVILRRPLETAPAPPNPPQAPKTPKPPRRSRTARPAPKRREWVPIAHRSRAAQAVPAPSNETIGGSRPNALTIAPSIAGESPSDATPASDTPSAPEEAVAPAVDSTPLAAAVELEDYLL